MLRSLAAPVFDNRYRKQRARGRCPNGRGRLRLRALLRVAPGPKGHAIILDFRTDAGCPISTHCGHLSSYRHTWPNVRIRTTARRPGTTAIGTMRTAIVRTLPQQSFASAASNLARPVAASARFSPFQRPATVIRRCSDPPARSAGPSPQSVSASLILP
jgi:hypothetical protein